jgi:hypothetical protein
MGMTCEDTGNSSRSRARSADRSMSAAGSGSDPVHALDIVPDRSVEDPVIG